MRASATLSLLFTVSLLAQTLTITPSRPDSKSEITATAAGIANGCSPGNPVVTRRDSTIDINLSVIGEICPAAFLNWSETVTIGKLDPGLYKVRAFIDGKQFAESTLWVKDAGASFAVAIPAGPERGGQVVDLVAPANKPYALCNSVRCSSAVVTFGGVPATNVSVQSGVRVRATVPAHAPGAVDVTVTTTSGSSTAKAAFVYFSESAPPDVTLFEPLLIPLLFDGDGAGGTHWVTDAYISSTLESTTNSTGFVMQYPIDGAPLFAGSLRRLDNTTQYPRGLLWLPLRDIAADAHASLTVRETSRGTSFEVPIARESDFRPRVTLAGVPTSRRYRVTLRIYSPDPPGLDNPKIVVTVGGLNSHNLLVSNTSLTLTRERNSEPYFAVIPDLFALPPAGTAKPDDLAVVSVSGDGNQRLWAFVSIVDNETQQARVVSPMR